MRADHHEFLGPPGPLDLPDHVVALVLPGGEELQEHQVHERTYLLVAGGEVEIGHDGSKVNGGPGFLAHFGPNERHAVRAITDARIVLVLAPWPGVGHPSRFGEDDG